MRAMGPAIYKQLLYIAQTGDTHISGQNRKRDKNVLQLSSLSTFLRAKTHLIQDERHGSFTIQAITMLKHASVDKISRDQNLIRLRILVFYFSLIKAYLIQDASHGSRNIQAIILLRLMIHTSVDKISRDQI
jgi:hypothetical protein